MNKLYEFEINVFGINSLGVVNEDNYIVQSYNEQSAIDHAKELFVGDYKGYTVKTVDVCSCYEVE